MIRIRNIPEAHTKLEILETLLLPKSYHLEGRKWYPSKKRKPLKQTKTKVSVNKKEVIADKRVSLKEEGITKNIY